MKKGYITEIFSSFQGEGPYAGRRQIFIRFAGCPLSCFYCDTPYARDPTPGTCTVFGKEDFGKRTSSKENNSFGKAFLLNKRSVENPTPAHLVIEFVKELSTPDLHSISYTGGEPLLYPSFLEEIAREAKSMHLKNFIETNGYSARAFASVADYFDYASIDIKLRNHRAVEEKDYERLYSNAVECIKISVDREIETIVKVVVIKNTAVEEIEEICRGLAGLNIKFVLQPVTASPSLQSADIVPGVKELFALSETAGLFLHHVMVIPQVHKFMHIR